MGLADNEMARVGLLMGLGSSYGRDVALGVSRYARPTRSWLFNAAPLQVQAVEWLLAWRPSGIIAHASKPDVAAALHALNVPVVNVSNILGERAGFPRVGADDHRVGELAAIHFMDRGFKHYAFCGASDWLYSERRFAGYQDYLRTKGFESDLYEYPFSAMIDTPGAMWGPQAEPLTRWISGLPKPVAIFAAGDLLSFALSEVCRAAGVHVPEEVALLGVDNDAMICELAYPRLSSVDLSARRIGYEAAKLLDELMGGCPAPSGPRLLPPAGVTVRHSSDVTAIHDPIIAKAMRFIHERAGRNINVSDVLGVVAVSRRDLERRFRRWLGRSVLDEIRQAHIEQAKQLLADDGLSIAEIAQQSGFASQSRLSTVFHELTGRTPSDYRRQYRPESGRSNG